MLQLIFICCQILFFPCFKLIIIPKNKGKIKFNWKEKLTETQPMNVL